MNDDEWIFGVVIGCALGMACATWTEQAPEAAQGATRRLTAIAWLTAALAAVAAWVALTMTGKTA